MYIAFVPMKKNWKGPKQLGPLEREILTREVSKGNTVATRSYEKIQFISSAWIFIYFHNIKKWTLENIEPLRIRIEHLQFSQFILSLKQIHFFFYFIMDFSFVVDQGSRKMHEYELIHKKLHHLIQLFLQHCILQRNRPTVLSVSPALFAVNTNTLH